MATVEKNGVVVDPSTGSGNTSLVVKAKVPNLGNREAKQVEFSVQAPGVDAPKTFIANYQAAAEYVTFDATGGNIAVEKNGGNVTITGKSNSKGLTFSLGKVVNTDGGDIEGATLISTDIGNITYYNNTINGQNIEGDPGASATYEFRVILNAEKNETIEDRSQQLTVIGEGGSQIMAVLKIEQSAGDPILEVTPTTIDVPQDGSEVNVQVNTNTTFTVSAN